MRSYFSIFATAIAIVFSCHMTVMAGDGHHHGHEEHAEEETQKGPHGGRLLEKDGLTLEINLYEGDGEPRFRVFILENGKASRTKDIEINVTTTRFNGKKEEFKLTPADDYFSSVQTVSEPHSFDVTVNATYQQKNYSWGYPSYEGRTELSAEALKVANISIESAGPQEIAQVSDVYGRFLPNQDRVAHLTPRFPGVVKEIRKELGDRVERGEVIAVIESNQSLQPYELRSQIAGEVISRHATAGEFVSGAEEIFVVADLSEIWADFQVYRDDFEQIEKGQLIKVELGNGDEIDAKVGYVSPVTDEATQSKLVRAVIANPQGKLRPGLFVSGTLASAHQTVPIAVRREAIQTFRDWNVVYLTDGHSFQAMPVELGRKDMKYVEILSGISPGDRYVTRNSFVIKADIEKSGASHDH